MDQVNNPAHYHANGIEVIDIGIPDEWVGWFKETVSPGTSTVVILAEHVHVRALAVEARRFRGAELLYTTLSDSAMDELDAAFDGTDDAR